mmetsp:Transcript_23649/g.60150  ORF Transcript_23649/g.60150 Transcript_23649/m.60150 type:complete len:225 (+) Transcript_23649:263-937(+)
MVTDRPEAEASISAIPSHGFQATSLTPAPSAAASCSAGSDSHEPRAALQHQTWTPSSPAVARRAPCMPSGLSEKTGGDAQDTPRAWPPCAWKLRASHRCSTVASPDRTTPKCVTTVTVPSSEAQASAVPCSEGAQARERTGPCRSKSSCRSLCQWLGPRAWRPHTATVPSALADARSTPAVGGAQATWWTAPSWPPKSARKAGSLGLRTSHRRMWPSADAVARH